MPSTISANQELRCEACKRAIRNPRADLHVTEDGRFEHSFCATGRAATVILRAERGAPQRMTRKGS